MVLILSNKGALERKYGSNGFKIIKERLEELLKSIKKDHPPSHIIFVDAVGETEPQFKDDVKGIKDNYKRPLSDDNAKALSLEIHNLIRKYCVHVTRNSSDGIAVVDEQGLPIKFNKLRHLLIVGGHDIVPFYPFDTPLTGDKDKIIYSDAPYGSFDFDLQDEERRYLVPEWAVGRLPDGFSGQLPHESSKNLKLLIDQINTAIEEHGKSAVTNKNSNALGCVMERRYMVAEKIYQEIANGTNNVFKNPNIRKLKSPTFQLENNPKEIDGRLYQFYNLHGYLDSVNWAGEDATGADFVCMQPGLIGDNNRKLNGSIIVSEVCYGANIINKKIDDSIVLKFLEKGAKCFVGSTVICYGWKPEGEANVSMEAADVILYKFLRLALLGRPFGEALMQAKLDYLSRMEDDDINDQYDYKTLMEFVLYGDPTINMKE